MVFDDQEATDAGAPHAPRHSGLAVVSGLFTLLCFVGSPAAVVLGGLALRRIGASKGALRGEGWAWTGILVGGLQLAGAGLVFFNVLSELDRAPPLVADFLRGVTAGDDRAIQRSASGGLQAVAGRDGFGVLGVALAPLGAFAEVGERNGFSVTWNEGVTIKARYALRFARGEAEGIFVLVDEFDRLRVKEFAVEAPVLDRPVGVAGQPGQSLGAYRPRAGR